LEAVNTDL
jgi:hypothetical protein